MRRGRTLVWTVIGGAVAAVAVALVLIEAGLGTSPKGASSPAPPPTSAGEAAPVVTAPTSGTSSYLSDMKPAGDLAQLVTPGPVKISGSIYPKSISFYCNVGDQTAFPRYPLKQKDRRFQATIGLAEGSPEQFKAGVLLVGDGRTLRTVTVSVAKPKTVDVSVKGVRSLQLECFGSGNSATGGEAVSLVWGNARFAGGH
jgi:NPCBM/NEW2 domain